MEIILGKYAGFCFGVSNAIDLAIKSQFKTTYTFGELIHNNQELERLRNLNIFNVFEVGGLDELSEDSSLLIRAHGIGKDTMEDLKKRNINVIDATCKVVSNIHKFVEEKHKEGYEILIYGDEKHPEVEGILNWAGENSKVIYNFSDLENMKFSQKVYLVSQTTQEEASFFKIVEYFENLRAENEEFEFKFKNTICSATKNRQKEISQMAKMVDCLIVIGSKKSSNAKKLYTIGKLKNPECYFIESYKDLKKDMYLGKNKIGITAGASTPKWVIEEVINIMMMEENKDIVEESMETMEDLLKESENNIYPGATVKGLVVLEKDDCLIVDIGMKAEAILSKDDYKGQDCPKVGDEIQAILRKVSNEEGIPEISVRQLEERFKRDKRREVLKTLPAIFENKEVLEGVVVDIKEKGLLVSFNDVVGFMPSSQIELYFVRDLSKYEGQTMSFRIIDLDIKKKYPKIVISKRVIMEEEKAVHEGEFWETIKEGDVVKGTVKKLEKFGAFINLGYLDGLLHNNELSWNRSERLENLLAVGDEIHVKVISIDKDSNKIALSLKALLSEPFTQFTDKYNVGQVVNGKVKSITDYGAFVEIMPGVEGLVHISELSYDRVEKVGDVLKEGEMIDVEILNIYPDTKKISLSKKALESKGSSNNYSNSSYNEVAYSEEEESVTFGDLLKDNE